MLGPWGVVLMGAGAAAGLGPGATGLGAAGGGVAGLGPGTAGGGAVGLGLGTWSSQCAGVGLAVPGSQMHHFSVAQVLLPAAVSRGPLGGRARASGAGGERMGRMEIMFDEPQALYFKPCTMHNHA